MDDSPLAEALWRVFEPFHAVVYFAPDVKSPFEDLGLAGFWRGYFASRAAPTGPVPAEVVIATFYNFHPAMVRRAMSEGSNRSMNASMGGVRRRCYRPGWKGAVAVSGPCSACSTASSSTSEMSCTFTSSSRCFSFTPSSIIT